MSSATSGVFRGCRTLLAPAKSAATGTASKTTAHTTKAAAKPKHTPKATPNPKPKARSAAPGGILKPFPVSPALHNFLGVPEASRTEAVKTIWAHIKQYNLQNPMNKREIFCDEKLKTIFDGKEKVGFLEIGKLLSRHFVKAG